MTRKGARPAMSKPRDRKAEARRRDTRGGARIHSRKATAIHEAAHVVIARVLTLATGGATIEPDYDEGEAGHAITFDPYACIHEWEKRGKLREPDVVWHARIIVYMAAAEAELELLRRPPHLIGDSNDRYQIELMAEELSCWSPPWERLEPRLRAMTRMLVRRHRRLIMRVAKALLERTSLTGGELDRLVGRSVNDVKPNHAGRYLLAMAVCADHVAARPASSTGFCEHYLTP